MDISRMELTEAEDTKRRWQEYTKLDKRELNDSDDYNDVIIHLDILECEVKLSLWTKLVELLKFQLSYFKS